MSIDSYLRLLLYSVGVVSSAADFIDDDTLCCFAFAALLLGSKYTIK